MKLKTRKFWNFLPLVINYLKLKSKAARNKRMPEYYTLSQKCDMFRKYTYNILKLLGIKLKVNGFDNVPNGPCLLVPNHSTYLDPFFIASALWNFGDGNKITKNFAFIAKAEVKNKKNIFKIAELINTFFIDLEKPREIPETLLEFGNYIKSKKLCGVMFAEGHRTEDGKLGEFNSGAFRTAQSAFLPIVPVTINNACNALDNNRKGILEVEVTFHNLMKPIMFQTLNPKDIADQVKSVIASNYKDQVVTSKETIKNKYSSKKNK